jgi:hypothetical protein
LPDAVVKHVAAMASRIEYRSIEAARDDAGDVSPDAVLAERPIYKGGQILRSWQKHFVQTCVEDHKLHGKARYLIADDVGLGKTLSMVATMDAVGYRAALKRLGLSQLAAGPWLGVSRRQAHDVNASVRAELTSVGLMESTFSELGFSMRSRAEP